MPRKARLTAPGVVHHIMARGLDGMDIFREAADKQFFLSLLAHGILKNNYRCYAWALMDNHYHLLLRTSDQPLSRFMRRLNSVYASYVNKKYQRKGYLFQDRFKSIATQDQHYLEEIVRYIHLNPIRANCCHSLQSLSTYPWCGHAALVGKVRNNFQNRPDVLKRFSKDAMTAIDKYCEFMEKGLGKENANEIVSMLRKGNEGTADRRKTGCWVIGDSQFVREMVESASARLLNLREYRKKGWTIERLAAMVGEQMGVAQKEICIHRRIGVVPNARKAIAFLGHRVLGIPVVDIARYLNVSGPAVSMTLDNGEIIVKRYGLNKLIK